MRNTRPTSRPHPGGFTLTELLVVISLIVFLVGLAFPVINSLQSGSRIEAGLNTVGMAADVARQWVKPSAWDADATDQVQYEQYSGCAALFTPHGEIRIVTNVRNARARDTGRYLEDFVRRPSAVVPNGYVDRSGVDYINIPSGVGVAGIVRRGNNAFYIAPPFAIAFDQNGQLYHGYANAGLHGGDTTGRIYYDGFATSGSTSDGRFDLRSVRAGGYDPKDWDGSPGSNNEDVMSNDRPIRALPFEAIECVPGVVIYDQDEFEGSGFSFPSGGRITQGSAEGQWLAENGQTVFFSPHTGVALRDEAE